MGANVRSNSNRSRASQCQIHDEAVFQRKLTAEPSLTTQPPNIVAAGPGRTAQISFGAAGSGPLTYEWMHDGAIIANGELKAYDDGTLTLPPMAASVTGTYQVRLTNALGSVLSAPVVVSSDDTPRLADVSTRGWAGAGEDALIAGFSIRGTGPKNVLIRAVGLPLESFGVTGVLANPEIALFDGAGNQIDANDNWSNGPYPNSFFYGLNSAPIAMTSADAEIIRALPPGAYTVQVTGVGAMTGVALVEVYESPDEAPRLTNVSTRVRVGTDQQVAIAGFVVSGPASKRVLVRAVGPTLSGFGVAQPLADPVLRVVDGAGAQVGGNDDWSAPAAGAATKPQVSAAAMQAGAFPLPDGSADAATIVTLAPGAYTAVVSGANGGTGIALVEVYELP